MDISSLGFQKKNLVPRTRENTLLSEYFHEAVGKNERERNELASKLGSTFQTEGLLFPGVMEQHDFWYLVQLFATANHLDTSSSPKAFFPQKNIYIENRFFDSQSADFLSILRDKDILVPKRESSRQVIDAFLKQAQTKVHRILGESKWKLRLIEWNEILRLQNQMDGNMRAHSLHVNGYWKSPTEGTVGLFASSKHQGGVVHIDALWNETALHSYGTIFVLEEEEV